MKPIIAALFIIILAFYAGCVTAAKEDLTVTRIELRVKKDALSPPTAGELQSALDPFFRARRFIPDSEAKVTPQRDAIASAMKLPVAEGEAIIAVWQPELPTESTYTEVRLCTKADAFVVDVIGVNEEQVGAEACAVQEHLMGKFSALKMTVESHKVGDN